jgi:hypothetical protein
MTRTRRKAVPRPRWCGGCDERTRLAGDPPYRCPVCHPLAAGPLAAAWRAANPPEGTP